MLDNSVRRVGIVALAAMSTAFVPAPAVADGPDVVRIAIAHLSPTPGDFAGNTADIAQAIRLAHRHDAAWVLTGELAQSGYEFASIVAPASLPQFPDPWLARIASVSRRTDTTVFVGLPKRTEHTLHNSVVAIDSGRYVAQHAKVNVLSGPNESWAQPGTDAVMHVDGVTIGYYVCADAANRALTRSYRRQGAEILLSSAAWYPSRTMGPLPFWRSVTRRTGLPFVVANTTGMKGTIDFRRSPSGVLVNGVPVLLERSPRPRLVIVDWDRRQQTVTAVGTHRLNRD
jgi:predicted amidohydrolase